jgi:hypothetical protein
VQCHQQHRTAIQQHVRAMDESKPQPLVQLGRPMVPTTTGVGNGNNVANDLHRD